MVTSGTRVTEGKVCLHIAFQSIDYPANGASFAANHRGGPKPDTRCNLARTLLGADFGDGSRRLSEWHGEQTPPNRYDHARLRILDRNVPHCRPRPPRARLSSSQPGGDDGSEKDDAVRATKGTRKTNYKLCAFASLREQSPSRSEIRSVKSVSTRSPS